MPSYDRDGEFAFDGITKEMPIEVLRPTADRLAYESYVYGAVDSFGKANFVAGLDQYAGSSVEDCIWHTTNCVGNCGYTMCRRLHRDHAEALRVAGDFPHREYMNRRRRPCVLEFPVAYPTDE